MKNNSYCWSNEQIRLHCDAATLLCEIMDEAFEFIRQNPKTTEYEVQQFIIGKYNDNNLVTDGDRPIVAFRESTANIHYFAEESTALTLKENSLIMIDIWARLNRADAPYADITWMAWHGDKIPSDVQQAFDVVIKSRDKGLKFIEQELLTNDLIRNNELGKVMEEVTLGSDFQDSIPHAYGHSLGTTSCHGKLGVIYSKNKSELVREVGYTIEPGIYIKGKFGFRSEIDFYVDKSGKLVVTTGVQQKLEII